MGPGLAFYRVRSSWRSTRLRCSDCRVDLACLLCSPWPLMCPGVEAGGWVVGGWLVCPVLI